MDNDFKKNQHGKIPLPWQDEHGRNRIDCLGVYWALQQEWNGTASWPQSTRVCDALEDLNLVVSKLNPNTRLANLAREMINDLICYGTKRAKLKKMKPLIAANTDIKNRVTVL